jgi:hypothetical protein
MSDRDRPKRVHDYVSGAYDSRRWDRFRPRRGDIVVCTPNKCGTTWTQMLCALLVHQSVSFPQPLTRLSRWLDRDVEPIDEVVTEFEAQPFRRILKTHTPFDGLPYHEEVSYVFCGRDPRDVFLSMTDHMDNFSPEALAEALRKEGLPPDLELPTDREVLFTMWLSRGPHDWQRDGFPWGSVFDLTKTYWDFRHLPNLFFWHYADLMADLDGEARRLSAFLDIPVDESRWPALLEAARFESMKNKADELAPGAHTKEWKENKAFFRSARMGQWREVLSAANKELYDRVSSEIAEPAMKAWLEGGRAAGDPKDLTGP